MATECSSVINFKLSSVGSTFSCFELGGELVTLVLLVGLRFS
jgi:hypothetical protein